MAGATACADVATDHRAAFVQQVLVDDNRIWLYRAADKVADKFAVMADDPYDFMRGSAALHFADLSRPVAGRSSTRFLQTADATTVLIFGDPHPENATVCRAEPSHHEPHPPLSVEYVDLDAAGYGPWTLDLWRAGLGMAVLVNELPGCDYTCWEPAVDALVHGYVDGLDPAAPTSVSSERATDTDDWGDVLVDLFDESLDEGGEQKKTNKYAPLDDTETARAFVMDPDTRLIPLSLDEHRILGQLLDRMALPPHFRLLEASRRLGSGVSSIPALRYVVLYDRGHDGPEDDALMQLREVLDPPVFPGTPAQGLAVFPDNHTRVVSAARQLWTRPDADPRHVGAEVEGLSFKAVSWTSYFQDVDHTKLAEDWEEDKLDLDDILALAHDLGRVLGASHARARTRDGIVGRAVIEADLHAGGGPAVLEAEVRQRVRHDLHQLYTDHDVFRDLLDTEGPLLGAENFYDGVVP